MIRLNGVSKAYRTKFGEKVVLDDVTYEFKTGESVGILGSNGAGKSTLIRLIAGLDRPDQGEIKRAGRISWPLAFAGGFHTSLTGAENIAFVARIYGVRFHDVFEYVRDFSELGDYLDMPVKTYSTGMRARLAFGLSIALDFDVYLIDEITAVGDARFKARCQAALNERKKHADIIMVSHSFGTIESYCDQAVILDNAKLRSFASLGEAMRVYRLQQGNSSSTRNRPK